MSRRAVVLTSFLLFSFAFADGQTPVPILSGGVGLLGSKDAGFTAFQPVVAPVLTVPLGDRWLIESRADLRGFISRTNGTGPYQGQFFPTLEYAQVDYNAASWLTVTAGRFFTPFNVYNERLNAIWIPNFQEPPLIYPIGTRTTGYSNGGMIRGALISRSNYEVNYTAYVSASTNVNQLESARTAGGRAGIFLPNPRFELGVSFQRFLQGQHINSVGTYLSWQPNSAPVELKSEYAHSPNGHGYWIEPAFRFSKPQDMQSALGRLQLAIRLQQFFRLRASLNDSLPAVDVKRIEFGPNYFLPHDVKLNASYGRQFTSRGDSNIWNFGITYRFMFPLLPGGGQ